MTGNKRKKDDEGNSNNATVKKRKKMQRKHKKRQNTKEEVHIVNEATRESDQDSYSGTYLDCGVCCGRGCIGKHGWAILRYCTEVFHPTARFTHEQMTYIEKCKCAIHLQIVANAS